MNKKRGYILFSLVLLIALLLFGKPIFNLVSADGTNATISLVILSRFTENASVYGIFEPLCCSGGTGDWCLDNNVYNRTTHAGDVYCEGANAGSDILVNVQHVLSFNFSSITIGPTDTLECVLEQSDGSLLNVNETGLTLNSATYFLRYAISNDSIITRNESGSVHDLPWAVHNCSILYANATVVTFDLEEVIFMHRNLQWNTFDYQKSVFAESVPFKFFNNTRALTKYYISPSNRSYTRYLAFKHYAGSPTEEICFDGADNDGDNQNDSEDFDCRTFAHRYNVSEMNFTPPNFLLALGLFKDFSITGRVIDYDAENMIVDSLGTTNYWYTKNIDLDGSFKMRVYETSPGAVGYGYTIKNFPNTSSLELLGFLPSGYVSSYACGAIAGLPEGFCNVNLDCSACSNGLVDAVFIINSSNNNLDASVVMSLETVHGTTIEEEDFTVYFDPDEGLNNTNESDTSDATDSNTCDDSINNDLDISTDYPAINDSNTINRISYSKDCADVDCVGINGPSYTAEQDISFSQSSCEYQTETSCDDGYDNDFNDNYLTDAYGMQGYFYTDCHDIDCFGNDVECPSSESICNDGENNDWDYVDTNLESSSGHKIGNTDNSISGGTTWNNLKYNHASWIYDLTDCEDPDCDSLAGDGGTCEWAQELSCNDGFNNDALQTKDCVFSGVYGVVNNQAPAYSHAEYDCASYCRTNRYDNESGSQCNDGIDNDYDYFSNTGIYSGTALEGMDCGWNGTGGSYNPDTDCDLETMGNGYRCELGNESTCDDSFDNDYDGSHTTSGGWSAAAYDLYFSQFGMTYASNADCNDYDCAGIGNCPTNEALNASWCFDGADNDLDGIDDCSDSDCTGIANPADPTEVCFEYELNSTELLDSNPLTNSVQYCGNNKDDENKDTDNAATPTFGYNSLGFSYTGARSSKMDCNDLDCRQQFGQCGPCSSVENIEWNSCFDGKDNDHDGNADSADSDCASLMVDNRGYDSSNLPTTELSCSNQFDDDEDGDTDCLDSDCNGMQFSPDGRVCLYGGTGTETAANCSDDFDNDGDDSIDCYDSNCASQCALTGISGVGLTYAPTNSSFSMTGSVSVAGSATTVVRKGGDLYVSYSGSGVGGVTIVLGSYATAEVIDTDLFDVANAVFTSNPDGFTMDDTYASSGSLTFIRDSISSFSFTVRIPGKNVVSESFTIKSTAGIGTDTASGTFSTQVVNDAAPSIAEVRVEPSDGNLSAGDKLQVAVGNFTGVSGGQSNSGLAGRCRIQVTGPNGFSVDEYRNDCKSSTSSSWRVYTTGSYTVQTTVYDNTGNEGNTLIEPVSINVVSPKISLELSRASDKRIYFASGNSNYNSFDDEYNSISGTMIASFVTDTNNPYAADACELIIKDSAGSVVSTQDITGTLIDSGKTVNCLVDGRLDVDLSLDGYYTLTVRATDTQGYSLETSRLVFFNCNSLISSGSSWTCALADFDVDSYTEGVTLPFNYSTDGLTLYQLSCDSCLGVTNLGKDANGNGYDNACDPVCGDGYTEGNEECDDGNLVDGDGCDSGCDIEGVVPTPRGGGGGAKVPPKNVTEALLPGFSERLTIEPSPFEIEIKQGQTKTMQLKFTNGLNTTMSISLNYSEFNKFMIIKTINFIILPGESKTIPVDVFVGYNEIPEVYIGKISVTGNKITQYLDTVLTINEKRSLFDIFIKMIKKTVTPGYNASARINLTDLGDLGEINATLYYAIMDFNNTTLAFNEENITINGSIIVERALILPKNATETNYVFYSKISYEESYAVGSDTFTTSPVGKILFLILVIIILAIMAITFYILYKKKNNLFSFKNEY